MEPTPSYPELTLSPWIWTLGHLLPQWEANQLGYPLGIALGIFFIIEIFC